MKPFKSAAIEHWVVCLASLALASCATTRSYENSLSRWKGKRESDLIRQWGKPQQTEKLADGGKTLTYVKVTEPHLVRDPASRKTVVLPECKTRFLVDASSTILGWQYEGPDCRAY